MKEFHMIILVSFYFKCSRNSQHIDEEVSNISSHNDDFKLHSTLGKLGIELKIVKIFRFHCNYLLNSNYMKIY